MKLALANNSESIFEGDHVRLTCRRKGILPDFAEIHDQFLWHWSKNNTEDVEFGGNVGFYEPVGGKTATRNEGEFLVSHLTWWNISKEANGVYTCSHKPSGSVSSPLAFSVSSKLKIYIGLVVELVHVVY